MASAFLTQSLRCKLSYRTAFFTSLQNAIKTFLTVETVFKCFYRREYKKSAEMASAFLTQSLRCKLSYRTAFFTSLQNAIKTFLTVETVFKCFYRREYKKSAEMASAFLTQSLRCKLSYRTAFFTSLQNAIKTFLTVETVFKCFYRRKYGTG